MSVIIRLQGLPWSANALDVRHYFQGLSIPEGGVHIVGGEQGDVFVAFSTDEDARRAMLMDGGRINDSRIKLLLSSRSEMQKVIESARSKNLVMQGMSTPVVSMGVVSPSTPTMGPNPGVMSSAPGMTSTPNVSVAHAVQHKEMQSPLGMNTPGQHSHSQMVYVNRMMHPSMGPQQMSAQYQPMQHQAMMEFGGSVGMGANKNAAMLNMNAMTVPVDMPGAAMHDQGIISDASKKGGSTDRGSDRDRRDRDGDRSRERERDRDRERGRRRERSRSPRRRSRDRERDRFRERDRDRRRSTSRGRTVEVVHAPMSERGPREEGTFGDAPAVIGEAYTHDIDSRRGGSDGMMGQFRMDESPSRVPSNSIASSRSPFQTGRGGIMPQGENNGMRDTVPRMPGGSGGGGGRAVGGSRWDTPDDRAVLPEKPMTGDRNSSRNFGGSSSPHRSDERSSWDRDRRFSNTDDPNFHSGPVPQNGMQFRSLCIVIQGVPFNTNQIHIRDFFAGLSIPIDGIRLPVDDRGRRLPLAFVRFANERDRELALKRPGKQYMCNSQVEVLPCSDNDFLNATNADNANNFENRSPIRPLLQPPSRSNEKDFGDFCVLLKGLPFSCREGDVVRFFSDFNLMDVIIEYDRSGRAAGTGFVEFPNPMEAKRALNLSGEKIGHRYIDISLTSKNVMESARCGGQPNMQSGPGRGGNRENYGGPERGHLEGPFGRFNDGPSRSSPMFRDNFDRDDLVTDCCKVTGLPFQATDRDLLNFFSPVEVVPVAIHLMLNSSGQPSGDAFCEFANPHDCKLALRQNGAPVHPGSRYFITVKPVPRREVEHTLGSNAPPQNQPGHMRGDDMKPGLLGLTPGGMSDNHPPFRPQQDSPQMPPQFRPGHRPQGPPDHQGQPHAGGDQAGSPPPDHPMNRQGRDMINSFGRPGCVVGATNVPYRSTVEDILEYFQGFGLTKDCVIRRFNEKGLPTGDARIAFHCPEDAQAAIRQLNKTLMFGRPITLHLV